MRRLVFALLFGLVLVPLPLHAQGSVTLNICNTGKVDLDAIFSGASQVLNSKIRPGTCAAVAKSEGGGMAPAYLGLAFTDSRGQYGAARRFARIPYMGVKEMDAATWLAMKARGEKIPDPPRTLTLADGSRTVQRGNVSVPLQLLFQPAFPECEKVPTGGGAVLGNTTIVEVTNVCEDLGYTLTVETHLDSHEISLESESTSGMLSTNNQRVTFSEKPEIDWAGEEAKRKAHEQPVPVKWSDLLATLRNPRYPPGSSELRDVLPYYFVVRGTVSGVEVLQHSVGPTTNISVAHINFRESPAVPHWRPGTRPISEFNVCTERMDILQEKFGADFRTSMIGKTVEVHGLPFGEECYGQRASFQIYLGRQIRPVPSAVFAADTRVWVPAPVVVQPAPPPPSVEVLAASIDSGARAAAADVQFREIGRMRAACVEQSDKARAANPGNWDAINKQSATCLQAADRYTDPFLREAAPTPRPAPPAASPGQDIFAALDAYNKAVQKQEDRATQEREAVRQRSIEKAKPCAQELLKDFPDGDRSDPTGFQKGVMACVEVLRASVSSAPVPAAAPISAPAAPVAAPAQPARR